uniref:ATPase F1/V1/A1 complex alpha/beta subunit nucleotide-binding domain-containing protein n=1 Tax=Globisporangium ultimum (strain ATCC 200006 / CBS 805.95 / DAOM BR144) TaxID=431595 RepID=K3X5J9_GLOUD
MTQQLRRSTMERVALRLRKQQRSSGPAARAASALPSIRVAGACASLLEGSPLSTAAHRPICTTRVIAQRKITSDANEALLAQQMLDFMTLAEEKEGDTGGDNDAGDDGLKSELPVTGVVLDVKNNIASISGLRHATIGSVVSIHGEPEGQGGRDSDEPLCRGVVLFLEKKVAHVALFSDRHQSQSVQSVRLGMDAMLESKQLEIAGGLAKFAGKAVDPLGEPIELVYSSEGDAAKADDTASTDRISLAWGSKTVPRLMQRGPLKEPLETGILAIDCFKPLAFGHRFGILGPRNSGKTRMTLDIIAHQVKTSLAAGNEPPHFVYVCVGKPQTRVQQILQYLEQTDALPYTTIVSADERDSLIKQYLAPFSGCAIAEYFMKANKSRKSVVVYDDMATHTVVVESLVQTMKLPKISQLSLSAHAVLMERSAQLVDAMGVNQSLTTFALADAPDSSTGEVTEFQQKMTSIVDDAVGLESQLARQRVYPPVDVLTPGTSIRGPPFQSVALWKSMTKLRSLVNNASYTKSNVDVAKKLGLEVEPEDLEVLELQELVRQFFVQTPLRTVSRVEKEIGVFFLTTLQVRRVPAPNQFQLWDFVHDIVAQLNAESPELVHLIETHSRDQQWPAYVEEELTTAFTQALNRLRKEHQQKRQQQIKRRTR